MPLHRGFALRFLLAVAALALIHGIPLRKGKRASYASYATSARPRPFARPPTPALVVVAPRKDRGRARCVAWATRHASVLRERSTDERATIRVSFVRVTDRRTQKDVAHHRCSAVRCPPSPLYFDLENRAPPWRPRCGTPDSETAY